MVDFVWPEDSGTGAAEGDRNDAANFAAAYEAIGFPNFVRKGLGFTLNAGTPSLDISAGKAVVSDGSATATQTGETRDEGVVYVAELDARTGISLTDNDVNHVFLDIDLTTDDTINIVVNTTNSAPAQPSLKLGTVDTGADTTIELNRTAPLSNGAELQDDLTDSNGNTVYNFTNSEIPDTALGKIQNSTLANSSVTIAGSTVSLGSSTGVALGDLSNVGTVSVTDGNILAADGTDVDTESISSVTEAHVNLADLADVDTTVDNSQLTNSSVTVAGNSVSLGGSTAVQVDDLSDVTGVTAFEENTNANRPASGTEGRIFFESDTGKVLYDNGSSWVGIGVSDHSQLSGIGSSDHHTRPSAGDGVVDNSDTFDVRLDIDDSGTNIAQAYGINFGTNLDVTDDTDNTVTVDVAGTLGHSISDSGTEILAEPGDVNFGADFNVTDDGDGSATVTLEGTLNPNEVVFPGSGTGATSALPTTKTSGQYAIQDQLKFGNETFSGTTSTSYVTVTDSDIAQDFDKLKDQNGSVYVNFIYHVRGDVSARIHRQNAGTTVTGSAVSGTAGSQTWTFQESGWIDFSAETGFESYQVQIRSDDGNEVSYNSIIMMIATNQG